jgi:hypothetical protein
MSAGELDRVGVIRRVVEGRLPQKQAAVMMGVTARQARRLIVAYKLDGAAALVSKKRGRPGNRRKPADVKERALGLVRALYSDFGPTLAAEKLGELHDLVVSRETLRHWMRASGLWATRNDRAPVPHQPRFRRAAFGELVQIDGSEHHWFEGRGPYCSLLVYVDDATGKLMELLFVRTESAFGYFAATASYLRRHGKPVAFYSDKHSIFRVTREGSVGTHRGITQFGRALAELNIDIICANSPQAKGRVERMNQTLQDRLVKELRLRQISTMDAGKAFLPAFIADFNGRFSRSPRSPHDAHRPLQPTEQLDRIFCTRTARSMTANLVVHFERRSYVITPTTDTRPLSGRRRPVEVHQWADGRLEIVCDGKSLPYTIVDECPDVVPGEVVEQKRMAEIMSEIETLQRRGGRVRPGQSWLRDKPAVPPPKPPSSPAPETFTSVPMAQKDVEAEIAKQFVVHWQRRKAFLYKRTIRGQSAGGRPVFEDKLIGPVDAEVAQQWQARGDWSAPPSLHVEEKPPAEPRPPLPPPGQPFDEGLREAAGRWMAAKAHAREREKYQPVDEEAAWKEFMAQFPAAATVSPQGNSAHSAPAAPRASSPATEGQAEVQP